MAEINIKFNPEDKKVEFRVDGFSETEALMMLLSSCQNILAGKLQTMRSPIIKPSPLDKVVLKNGGVN